MPPSGASTTEYTRIVGSDDSDGSSGGSSIVNFLIKYGQKLWWIIVVVAMVIATALLIQAYGRSAPPPNVRTGEMTKDVESLLKLTWPIPDVQSRKEGGQQGVITNNNKPATNTVTLAAAVSGKPIILTNAVVQEAFAAAEKAQTERLAIEEQLRDAGYTVNPNSPAGRLQAFLATGTQAQKLAIDGFTMDQVSKYVAKRLNLTADQAKQGVVAAFNNKADSGVQQPCVQPLNETTCIALNSATNIYHSSDGLCNNVHHPGWGATEQPYRRILLPDYNDGISSPRALGKDGTPLPHPRKISTFIHSDVQADDPIASLLLPIFGQFLDHDITSTALGVGTSSRVLNCCKNDTVAPVLHPECFPFYVKPGDELYAQEGEKCTNIWRSARYPSCEIGPRSQFSQTTSYIDGSVIYGNNDVAIRAMRDVNLDNPHGYMTTFKSADGRSLLPVSTDLLDGCNVPDEVSQSHFCFTSGDPRVNEQMALTSMHLLWVRQHNHVADQLTALNPDGHDGKVYFETREIIIAQIQHVTYNEFLPVLFGKELMDAAGLTLEQDGYYSGYDETVDATISNVFAAAAYRMGHSMMQNTIKLLDANGNIKEEVPLHELFYDPFRLWQAGNFDGIMRGLTTAPSAQVDSHFTNELTKHLFENRNGSTVGLDLAALNIQRGRDHGLPPYTEWRKVCGLDPVTEFTDLVGLWKPDTLYLARNIYKSVEDVDLYTGMLAEKTVPSGMVGPTLACLLMDQFLRLRKGDRFWYEGNVKKGKPIPLDQLQEIRKTTLARIICDNGDGIKEIQLRPLERPSTTNPIVSCNSLRIPTLDYTLWFDNVNSGLLPKKN